MIANSRRLSPKELLCFSDWSNTPKWLLIEYLHYKYICGSLPYSNNGDVSECIVGLKIERTRKPKKKENDGVQVEVKRSRGKEN